MVRRTLFLAAALLLTVSCGGGQKGAAPPPPITSTAAAPSASPSPSVTATPFVSSADEAGAFAFTRGYLAELQHAFETGDLARLKPLRRDTCAGCLDFESRIKSVYQAGGAITGAHLTVRNLLLGQSGPSFAKVTANVVGDRTTTLLDGRRSTGPASSGAYYLLLVRDGDHWVVDQLRGDVKPKQ